MCCRCCGRGRGGLVLGEFEEIKALFVLRGIGEWVQLVPAAVIYG